MAIGGRGTYTAKSISIYVCGWVGRHSRVPSDYCVEFFPNVQDSWNFSRNTRALSHEDCHEVDSPQISTKHIRLNKNVHMNVGTVVILSNGTEVLTIQKN